MVIFHKTYLAVTIITIHSEKMLQHSLTDYPIFLNRPSPNIIVVVLIVVVHVTNVILMSLFIFTTVGAIAPNSLSNDINNGVPDAI